MSGTELAFAISLLVAPPGTPYPKIEPAEWPTVQVAICKVAIDWEIMDPREASFMMTKPEDMKEDLEVLRTRFVELNGAPLVNDAKRFPGRDSISDMLSLNRNLRKHIEVRQHVDTDRASAFRAALHETDTLYRVWDAVRDAKCEFYYVTVRRQALKKVRNMIGAEAYYTGNLPPHIPTWRFQE
jgi:hypothetical protein